jgi:hypothetical protein
MRLVFRVVLVVVLLAIGAYLLGYWTPGDAMMGRWRRTAPAAGPAQPGTAADRLGKLEESAGQAAQKVDAFVSDAALTAKIKSKMTLDDVVRARTIGVSTSGGVVTLEGTVRSPAERDQALRLARDTTGVTKVVDRLVVQP